MLFSFFGGRGPLDDGAAATGPAVEGPMSVVDPGR